MPNDKKKLGEMKEEERKKIIRTRLPPVGQSNFWGSHQVITFGL